MLRELRASLVLLGGMVLLTGLLYPAAVTGIAQLLFPAEASGSLVFLGGEPAGSRLIGQPFSDAGYFWGRPSATNPLPYNAASSSGSNLGPSNPALLDSVRHRVYRLRKADSTLTGPIPVDLATASGSGLDPHISVEGALVQIPRVALARNIAGDSLRALVEKVTEPRQLGLLGEPRVNVLILNLALDAAWPAGKEQ